MKRDIATRWFHAQRKPDLTGTPELRAVAYPNMAGGRNLHLTVGRRCYLIVFHAAATRRQLRKPRLLRTS